MRFTLILALLLLPATAFAQSEMILGPIPVHRCVQTPLGDQCGPVRDGAGFAAADGYTRAYRGNATAPSRHAMAVTPEQALTR